MPQGDKKGPTGQGSDTGRGKGQGGRPGRGPGGDCICPKCGERVPHTGIEQKPGELEGWFTANAYDFHGL
ncbi:MAG: hypothetical protein JRF69_09735 [Deltaproteobacteria bacterium]|nr:hypothetical protein [Deltaproteobacteria bacterium]